MKTGGAEFTGEQGGQSIQSVFLSDNDHERAVDNNIVFYWDFYDLLDEDEYLIFGAWSVRSGDAAVDANDRGGFALGRAFPVADLPTEGTATYQGDGGVFAANRRIAGDTSTPADDIYRMDSALVVNFAADGEHTLRGTLTENGRLVPSGGGTVMETGLPPLFVLNLEESRFRQGEFADGAVTCGGGMCEYEGGGSGMYNAKFFGTAGAGGNPTKLGGTFKATGLNLEGKGATNVVGGFGAELQ